MSQVHSANDTNFDSEVIQNDTPVLVDFSATWCGPCKRLEPIVEELAGEFAGRLKVVKVDIDEARTTASQFGVMSVPTVVLFKSGEVQDTLVGLNPKAAFVERIERVL